MKRIIVCCDGTWNIPDKTVDGVPVPTNVVKLAMAVKPRDEDHHEQLVYYDTGVGTSGSWLKRMLDGMTGGGLSLNIMEAYEYLVRNYVWGDELYFFGFSRGAFTVRSLAGFIRNCGILKPNAVDMVDEAFKLYRSRSHDTKPSEKEATLFRRTYSVSDITPIKFIGVWDTVGALGNPLFRRILTGRKNQFHDTDLSSTVQNALHALAIDEKRSLFKATMWHQQKHAKHQHLEQVWFAGVHSNIGGGYKVTGLSDIALQWMCEKARDCGIDFHEIDTNPDYEETCQESRKSYYLIYKPHHRPIGMGSTTHESIHSTVSEKYSKDPLYRPRELVKYYENYG